MLIYAETSNPHSETTLDIHQSLFALGIDGSLQNPQINTISMGTGLSIIITSNQYYVQAYINNTVIYRNQASYGANLNLVVYPASCSISVFEVKSPRAVSYMGGILYKILPFRGNFGHSNTNSLTFINSSFSTDYKSNDGIYVDISQDLGALVQVINCSIRTNFKIFSSNSTSIVVVFLNSYFRTRDCSGGIGGYYSSF